MSESDSQPGGGLRAEDRRPENVPPAGVHSGLRALVAEGRLLAEEVEVAARRLAFTGEIRIGFRGGYRVGTSLLEDFGRGR